MAGPAYVGEIRAFAFGFAPRGWLQCIGQTLPINQYAALFSILGTTYGGNGQSTFMLPNLQGNVPIGMGTGGGGTYVEGQIGGTVAETITQQTMPIHTHAPLAGGPAASNVPANQLPGSNPVNKAGAAVKFYATAGNVVMNTKTAVQVGGGQPHTNMAPYLTLNYCICQNGIFPSRN